VGPVGASALPRVTPSTCCCSWALPTPLQMPSCSLAHRVGLTEPRQTPGGRKGKPRLDPAVVQEVLDAHLRSRRWPPELAAELDLSVMVDRVVIAESGIRFVFVASRWGGRLVLFDDDVDPRWLSSGGSIQCPYEADRLALAEENGGIVAITEGISDAASIIAAVPTLAVVGIPGTNGFKAKWVDAFADLYVLVFGDNDAAGEKFRVKGRAVPGPTANCVPGSCAHDYGDVTDWLIGASDRDTFAHDLLDACRKPWNRTVIRDRLSDFDSLPTPNHRGEVGRPDPPFSMLSQDYF